MKNFSDISITTKDPAGNEELINALKIFKKGYLSNSIKQSVDNILHHLDNFSGITKEQVDNHGFQSLLKQAKEADYKYQELKKKYEKLP